MESSVQPAWKSRPKTAEPDERGCRAGRSVFRRSVEHCEANIGIELTSFDAQSVPAYGVDHGECLAGPGGVIQLVECDDRSLRHSWQKVLDRNLGRSIEIEV